ncbi:MULTISPECIES: type I-C CRISPR-associated protein Cas8c/Csd1 [Neisseriaceae]|uniref:CRISPR-associated protein Csd1 n=1 Tax=Morococcus cerebrosus TaxID=1056807 RepID=A0A0C1H0Z9_9NEIS|nr:MULTISPECIES: type I-C CRISPR-associated protein Cas8c/Csd1 [Neisseriaceae]KIC12110.1 CRISPR-associated protein Csd1 [Morococcus cerebrosus]OFJ67416.1 type I-C CRISPR-associated protein Cas8c/Csd1 [Neisseria sp. HMSC073B07]UNV88143.1 type I-C CRISPR-associated protein Cas8c/Csd1 [Morococcus cerebrosus]
MILHALTQYYQRKAESDGGVAPEGFENKEIPFIIVIDKQGNFIQLEDTRELKGKKKVGRTFLVPKGLGRSGSKSYEVSNILWDHYGYVLAYAGEKGQEQADRQHASFTSKVNELKQALPDDAGVAAVAAFLASAAEKSKAMQAPNWVECAKVKGCNLSFRLVDEAVDLVCQSKAVRAYVSQANQAQSDNVPKGICLVTGKPAPIARLHNAVKGVNAKPAPFTSVNLSAFESYGKEQGFIFPVGEQAMFEYTTALNTLLAGKNHFRIGDVTAVCWSAKPTPLEESLASLISGGGKDNPDEHIDAVKTLYKSLYNGQYQKPDGKEKFYLLGLSPNSARIVVRFWHETTVATLSEGIAAWYDDLQMVRGENSPYPEYMPLPRLLGNLVLDGKMENLPSDLIAQVTDAALNNRVLPVSLLQAALRRNKAEQKITYGRASLLKAYINRAIRAGRLKNMKELTMSLDRNRQDIGYVLGRLFAVLEKTQDEANPGLNATIADRYFGSASSTPIAVFGTLIRLSKHHLSKLNTEKYRGKRIFLEKLFQEIIGKIDNFPNHLDINHQVLFGIGYYHQKQDFFQSNSTETIKQEQTL